MPCILPGVVTAPEGEDPQFTGIVYPQTTYI
jgi:hypothetical protein